METSNIVDECMSLTEYLGAEIFLIDDEQLVVDTLTYFLRSAGFRKVHGFSNSEEAIEEMRFVRPDVIYTDIRMPGFSGNALAKIVRSFPHLYTVPIIAITADHSFEASRSIINDGAESVLIKPVARDTLVKRTVQAIDNEFMKPANLKPGPDVEFMSGLSSNQSPLPGLFLRDESAVNRRLRRKNSFRRD